ncbi:MULTISPECIES: hypothetical protein [unclassified Colwellia]|uniref:hypothetical protein n=1 Tax=unclassified Colwellia TaxID=196834 RepID=UPI0015F74EF5|nr:MULTISPECIES: hypothetical protein [unclassified Colwellia]MBA6253589.1 hypothetical protein [Colwellia sp. MB3u-55]MBA6397457.1 hypothetical protein [Colwellia sp. BRX10-4]
MQKKHLIYLSCLLMISITFTTFQSNARQDQNMDSDTEKQIVKPIKHPQRHVVPTLVPDDWGQDVHDTIANSVYQSATWFDSFFTDIDSQQIEPKATAKIRFGWIPKARHLAELDSRFRLKIKLPHFKDKMSLILSDEDDVEDGQLPLDGIGTQPEINEESFAAALRYVVKKKSDSLVDTRLGISGGDIFIKIRKRKLYTFNEKHGFKVEPSTYYFLGDGLGAKLFLEYNYQYNEKSQYRVNYTIRGSESFSGIRWKHGFYQLNQLDSTTASVVGLQVEGERNGQYGFFTDKYTLSYRYRFNALEKWLFFEVEPFLEWSKEDNYTTTPGIALRIEGFFSKI